MVNDISNSMTAPGAASVQPDASETVGQAASMTRPSMSQATAVEQAVGPSETARATPGPQAVSDTVSRLNEAVQVVKRDLRFRVDDKSGRTIITVLDSETKEVIRQIPPEQVLTLAENIESLKGVLFSAEA
jgi:flagellar protein FlaG